MRAPRRFASPTGLAIGPSLRIALGLMRDSVTAFSSPGIGLGAIANGGIVDIRSAVRETPAGPSGEPPGV